VGAQVADLEQRAGVCPVPALCCCADDGLLELSS